MPKVWNRRDPKTPPDAVYVGRPTKWGNPFAMHTEAERDWVCDQYERYVQERPTLIAQARKELKGKDLVCWCAPKRCHADVLLEIANAPDDYVEYLKTGHPDPRD